MTVEQIFLRKSGRDFVEIVERILERYSPHAAKAGVCAHFGVDQIEEFENENILFDYKLRVGFFIQQRARVDAVDWSGCLINSSIPAVVSFEVALGRLM